MKDCIIAVAVIGIILIGWYGIATVTLESLSNIVNR